MTLPKIDWDQLPRQAYGFATGHDLRLTQPENYRKPVNSRFMPKPEAGGLWTATVTKEEDGRITGTTWLEYCQNENFGLDRYTEFVEIVPTSGAQILMINSLADLRAIHAEYGFKPDERFPDFAAVLDWERMALDWVDGVYLTHAGQYSTRFPDDNGPSLYGWDTESLLWLNPAYRVVTA